MFDPHEQSTGLRRLSGHKTSVLVVLIILVAALLSCSGGGGGITPLPQTSPMTRGVSFSPQGFPLTYDNSVAFFAEAGAMGHSAVMWNGAWRDDAAGGSDAGTVPLAATATADAGATYGFTPVAVFGWRTGTTLLISVPTNTTNDWSNTQAGALYSRAAASYAAAYHPGYLFLGNENDFYYEQNAADYANWITAYNAAYDAVKAVSPSTLVGPVFSFEHTAGSGTLNGWTTTHWGAIAAHDLSKVDVLGLTLYPWLGYATPAAVLANYLDPIFSRIGNKPVVITETGWPAENLGSLNPLWETSDQAQLDYIPALRLLIRGRDVRLVNWLFLSAMEDPGGSPVEWKLFGSVSLRTAVSGSSVKRPVYDAWVAF